VNHKFWLTAVAACTLLVSPTLSLAKPAADTPVVRLAGPQAQPGQAFAKLLSDQEAEVVSAAEAMPADKYNFAPSTGEFKGVRTFAQQITHVAEAQYFFFGGFGIKPAIDPKGITKLTNKGEIVAALKGSFAFAKQAAATITPENAFAVIKEVDGANTRATIAAFSLAHTNDHYGQMVEYLRLNSIVPPASR
jgi:DinB superfamily